MRRIIDALRQKEFRFFLLGAFLSNIGSWMQSVAQAWLVLELTNSPFYLGLDGFANTLPIAIFAFWGGVIADRFDRRRMLIATQWMQLSLALLLGLLLSFGHVHVWTVIVFSFLSGLTQSIAWPVYQTLVANIVPREQLSNAIALNSTQFNLARMIGPVLGAMGLHLFGTAGCFYANGISYLAVLGVLYFFHGPVNRRVPDLPVAGYWDSFRQGLAHMVADKKLLWLLLILAASSVLGVPLVTLLPVFARDILHVGASGLGLMVGAFGAGAVVGGGLVAYRGNFPHKGRMVMHCVFLFIAAMLGFSVSRVMNLSLFFLLIAGFSMVGIGSVINTQIQESVPDHLRGRAMSLFVFAFGGCMPLGNLLVGILAKTLGSSWALGLQGMAFALVALYVSVAHPEVRD